MNCKVLKILNKFRKSQEKNIIKNLYLVKPKGHHKPKGEKLKESLKEIVRNPNTSL